MSKYIKLEDALTAFAEACKGKVLKVLSDHQIIKAFRDNINNLPTIEVSEDCISREYILGEAFASDEYNRETKSFDLPVVSVSDIEDAPSVVPSRAEGEWLFKRMTDDYHIIGQCSLCKELRRIGSYCPNCGARMKGSRR